MKIVVICGTGLIGSKTVAILCLGGHDVIGASPKSGINTITGEGLKEAMAGAQVVIDLANSPSFEDKAVLEFFQTSGRNLLAAGWLLPLAEGNRIGRAADVDHGVDHFNAVGHVIRKEQQIFAQSLLIRRHAGNRQCAQLDELTILRPWS